MRPLPEAPWAIELGAYFVMIGLATGITLVGLWIRPSTEEAGDAFDWFTGWIALGALSLCGLVLVLDLGQPLRFHLMITRFGNLGSVMSIGAKLLALKGALLALHLYLVHRRRTAAAVGDREAPDAITRAFFRGVPALLGVASAALAIYPALLLSRTWSSPLGGTVPAGLLFVITACLMGAAAALLVTLLAPAASGPKLEDRLVRVLGALVILHVMAFALHIVTARTGGPALERAIGQLLSGSGSIAFWSLAVGVGVLAPIVLLLVARRQRTALMCAASMVLIGAGTSRYLLFAIS